MLEHISHCQTDKLRFVSYNLMIPCGTTSQQTYIFPENFHQYWVHFCLVCYLFLPCWILKGFPCSRCHHWGYISSEMLKTRAVSLDSIQDPKGKRSPHLRYNWWRTTRIFELSVPRAAAGIPGGTMAWCFSGTSMMWWAVPWHLREGRTEWQKAIPWLSDLQR